MSSDIQRRLRRSKDSERRFGRWLKKHDGEDPHWANLATSNLRVGHITQFRFDNVSLTYTGENKQIKVWAGLWTFWKQIVDISKSHRKEPLLRIEPTNEDAAGYPVLHVITEDRHAELLAAERLVRDMAVATLEAEPNTKVAPDARIRINPDAQVRSYSKEQQTGRKARR